MKLANDFRINKKLYKKGEDIPGFFVYPFFLLHMGVFGFFTTLAAYGAPVDCYLPLFAFGTITVVIYLVFYLYIFGRDEVSWIFINAGLGLFGILAQIDWLLALFDRSVDDYPIRVHAVPVVYYVLYTFLLRQALLDLFKVSQFPERTQKVASGYIGVSLMVYGSLYLLT